MTESAVKTSAISSDNVLIAQITKLALDYFGNYRRAIWKLVTVVDSEETRIIIARDYPENKLDDLFGRIQARRSLLLEQYAVLRSHFDRLLTMDGVHVFRDLHVTSHLTTEDERTMMDVQQSFLEQLGKPVVRKSCGESLESWLDSHACDIVRSDDVLQRIRMHDACSREASRILDAGFIFGLVETDPCFPSRRNHKPLRATCLLQEVMKEAARPTMELMRDTNRKTRDPECGPK